jgi:hypothetical protein
MTCARTQIRPGSGSTAGRHKAVLICPRCHHESSVEGDWIHTIEQGGVELHCPDCFGHLTTRPR